MKGRALKRGRSTGRGWIVSALVPILAAAFLQVAAAADTPQSGAPVFTCTELEEDVRQLARILDSAHPDPYGRGGGRIAFHRRMQDALRAIPDSGMTASDFHDLLLPLVASVRDGHTGVWLPGVKSSPAPGLPFRFRVIGESLYVAQTPRSFQDRYWGAILESVAGVPFDELVSRQGNLRGYDNDYHNLKSLVKSLRTLGGLRNLLPLPGDGEVVEVGFLLPGGERLTWTGALTGGGIFPWEGPESAVEIPSVERTDLVYDFLDDRSGIALLRSESMMTYREAFEWLRAVGNWDDRRDKFARETFERYHGTEPPSDINRVIAGIPSATDLFRALFTDMKKRATKTLIVDLRHNGGGSSIIVNFLTYFLKGREGIVREFSDHYQIRRYSPLYFENSSRLSLEQVNRDRELLLRPGDYSFTSERAYRAERESPPPVSAEDLEWVTDNIGRETAFAEELKEGKFEAYYEPDNIVVLTSAETYSAGFDLAVKLYRMGAILVGTPSAQSGNCFIDAITSELNHSGIGISLSSKVQILFPEDEERGRVLMPDHRLTYEKLAELNFDPNAGLILALEVLATH